jgi:DNA-binding response OmpR family regulator
MTDAVMEKSKILIIEDNADTRHFLETALAQEFEVISSENAVIGIDHARTKRPDLIILDIMLPILNGFDACGLLKKDDATKSIPIIFLSAKNTVSDITQGLGLGADDYLPKPFDYKELIARIKARLREKASWQSEPKTLMHGDLKLVLDTRDALFAGKSVELTQTEFDILKLLVQKIGQVVPRDEIIQSVWKGTEDSTHRRTIDVHIRALRKKIPSLKRHVLSIYGVGYKYER